MKVFSVQLVEKITWIFCSTHQLDVQEKVASLLFEITHQSVSYILSTNYCYSLLSSNCNYIGQLYSILMSKSFFSQLLDASLSGDSPFQSLALEIILSLAKLGKLFFLVEFYKFIDFQFLDQTISLLLNDEFFKKLVNLLDGSESPHQIMVLKLFLYLLPHSGYFDTLFVLYNYLY